MKIVPEHRIKARVCTDEDVRRIAKEAEGMRDLFGPTTVALGHSQVDDEKPLRFFVLRSLAVIPGMPTTVIVNPRIVRHSGYTVDSPEGCHTFNDRPHTVVQRWLRCDVEYQVLMGDQLSPVQTASLKRFPSFVFQHETDHLDARYCYDHEI